MPRLLASRAWLGGWAAVLALTAPATASATPTPTVPTPVTLPSADGHTTLVAYRFEPDTPGPHPAVVLLHGRAGPYSSRVSGGCTQVGPGVDSACGADTLSARHLAWGRFWAERGVVALLVDSFGPRGRAHGYGRGTHGAPEREAVNELTVRPLDAEGALAWLAAQPGVQAGQVLLQGWSNGGSTVLNTLHRQAQRGRGAPGPRFAAGVAFYPGCGPAALLARRLQVDVPLLMLLGSADEEVSPTTCRQVAAQAQATPPVAVHWYDGATHDFDDPGRERQALPANRSARDDALSRVPAFTAPVLAATR